MTRPAISRPPRSTTLALAGLLACALLSAPRAHAQLVLYTGSDAGVGPGGARPNSNAAAASFDAAAALLGTVNTITFESVPVGYFTSQTVAPGVTATTTNLDNNLSGISGTAGNASFGYNTTTGGERYLYFVSQTPTNLATVTFSFATPINAFGSFITGVGTASGSLFAVFNDGTSREFAITGSSTGGVQFFGFTNASASISSVSLELRNVVTTRDNFGIDDVRYVTASTVPEPSTYALLTGGLLVLGGAAARRRRASAA